jgi:hypothetical protein
MTTKRIIPGSHRHPKSMKTILAATLGDIEATIKRSGTEAGFKK